MSRGSLWNYIRHRSRQVMSEDQGDILFTKLPQEMTGLYYVNGQLYIIADHPQAEKWRAAHPQLPSAFRADLEKMPLAAPPPKCSMCGGELLDETCLDCGGHTTN
jgi:hypothetical protein